MSSNKMKTNGRLRLWKMLTLILSILCVAIFTALLVAISKGDKQHLLSSGLIVTKNINTNYEIQWYHELSLREIESVLGFIRTNSNLKIVPLKKEQLNNTFVHFIELKLPDKDSVLHHLDKNGSKPVREARVVVFRGNLKNPCVQEYIVGPLPKIRYMKKDNRTNYGCVPYYMRALTKAEFRGLQKSVIAYVEKKAKIVLEESYGALPIHCKEHCLDFVLTPVSNAFLERRRKVWIWFTYRTEFHILHPVDFQFLADITDPSPDLWKVEEVWYANKLYPDLDTLLRNYSRGNLPKSQLKFPTSFYETLSPPGETTSKQTFEAPELPTPGENRYKVSCSTVEYFSWKFNFHIAPSAGLRLLNIRFREERIVYELSMQEVNVIYSGNNPAAMMSAYLDSAGLFGTRMKGLHPGIDCPTYATFMSTQMFTSVDGGLQEQEKALCIFEHNNQIPLRRHKNSKNFEGSYGGMSDNVLIVRNIIKFLTYDYVIDSIFHNNGVMEVRVLSTGYLLTTFYYSEERAYGTQIKEHVSAGMHSHMFHFKVDLDIKGESNRFETLDIIIENKTTPWEFSSNIPYYCQKSFKRVLREDEKQGCVPHDSDSSKYMLFHNIGSVNKFDNPRSYRLVVRGSSKLFLPRDFGVEKTVSWTRYQLAVTKRKEEEERSSSIYAMWDLLEPVVDFQKYLEDNESIVDKDLVAWVTLGLQHIPQMENVPNVATVGTDVSFTLFPYNYFDRDPSMESPDAYFCRMSKDEDRKTC